MEWWTLPLLAGAGIGVGFLNVMAGGGSALSMPLLILLGLDPATANGTNRVAILIQNISAVDSFRRRGFFDPRQSLSLGLCTLPGAVAGAILAVQIDPLLFRRILAVVLVAAMILIIRPPRKKVGDRPRPVWAHLAAVGIGAYGGFIQAGVGFLLMPMLVGLMALDLVRVNMHKVFIVGCFTVPSLLVFAISGNVWWLGGLALSVGNAAGARLGTRLTVDGGERAVRWVFVLAASLMAVKLALAG